MSHNIDFQKRSISSTATVGERLCAIRLSRKLTLERVANDLNIKLDYLVAIEKSNYLALPSGLFVRNYVVTYAKYLKANSPQLKKQLEEELKIYQVRPSIPTLKPHLNKPPLKIANIVIVLLVIFVALGVGTYFIVQINNIIQPPPLTIDSLPPEINSKQQFITITGKTIPEASVLINNQAIMVREDGSFSQTMTIQTGVNLFKFVVKTKRSRERVQYEQIIVRDINN